VVRYDQTVEFLYRLQWHGIRLDLDPTLRLLLGIGNPHLNYPVIHVGGTNGKGSTAAMTASVFRDAGYSVGLYTSPHLLDFTERIRINGRPIAQAQVAELTEEIRAAVPVGIEPTFFEFTTALAFFAFARAGVDLVVAEVGMGGRLDATNVVTPVVSVITNVEVDHQRYLGEHRTDIAREKAGIIKHGVPLITAVTHPEVREVLRARARAAESPVVMIGSDAWVEGDSPACFSYHGPTLTIPNLTCPLRGRHQMTNAATAIAAVEAARQRGLVIAEASIRRGIARVLWEGRLEEVRARPTIIVDGAHNPAGAEALARFLEDERARRGGRLTIIFGILADKDLEGIIGRVGPLADEVILTQPTYHRAAPLEAMKAAAASVQVPVRVVPALARALEDVETRMAPDDWCVVTGSLYTVGEVKAIYQGLRHPSPLRG